MGKGAGATRPLCFDVYARVYWGTTLAEEYPMFPFGRWQAPLVVPPEPNQQLKVALCTICGQIKTYPWTMTWPACIECNAHGGDLPAGVGAHTILVGLLAIDEILDTGTKHRDDGTAVGTFTVHANWRPYYGQHGVGTN